MKHYEANLNEKVLANMHWHHLTDMTVQKRNRHIRQMMSVHYYESNLNETALGWSHLIRCPDEAL